MAKLPYGPGFRPRDKPGRRLTQRGRGAGWAPSPGPGSGAPSPGGSKAARAPSGGAAGPARARSTAPASMARGMPGQRMGPVALAALLPVAGAAPPRCPHGRLGTPGRAARSWVREQGRMKPPTKPLEPAGTRHIGRALSEGSPSSPLSVLRRPGRGGQVGPGAPPERPRGQCSAVIAM